MKTIDVNRYNAIVPVKQDVEADLIKQPDVTGVGIGFKKVGGEETDELAILVFVKKKGYFESSFRVPAQYKGIKTDVIEGVFRPADQHVSAPSGEDVGININRYDPVKGGCSTSPARLLDGKKSAGTLGVMVKDNVTGGNFYLSNWHVFCGTADWSAPQVDRRIIQPGLFDGGKVPADVIGVLQRGHVGKKTIGNGHDVYVDAAVCDSTGRKGVKSIIEIGDLAGARVGELNAGIIKYGRTTELTQGRITDLHFTVKLNYGGTTGEVIFYDQYRYDTLTVGKPVAQQGDSGAIITDKDKYAVALHFAANDTGSIGLGNPIGTVLEAMNISLL